LQEKPGGGGGKGGGQESANAESLSALIDICEKAACRRRGILNFFGDKEGVCHKGCDFCRDPKGVNPGPYRGTSLIRKYPPPQDHPRTLGMGLR